jgi:hypothetical protein
MEIKLQRLSDNGKSTIGKLTVDDLEFYTLEDTFRSEKIKGETRIPQGTYEIKLRTYGSHHVRYKKRFPEFHKGMLWLQEVPNFTNILIHIGNTIKDTMGCILIGMEAEGEDLILRSTTAYIRFYKHVVKAFDKGENVYIKIMDN